MLLNEKDKRKKCEQKCMSDSAVQLSLIQRSEIIVYNKRMTRAMQPEEMGFLNRSGSQIFLKWDAVKRKTVD